MSTGLGKTVTFANLPRRGRMLILSHREELVHQPLRYFTCRTGIEMAGQTSSLSDEVVSASVQSLARRLDRFRSDDFDIIVTDEAQHAIAPTYRKIYEHFQPRLHLGFTATPNRSDSVRLDDIFQEIIFQRDLRWGIENGWLANIYCRRVNIGYNLSHVHSRYGDYAPGELDEAMSGTSGAVAEAYRTMAKGATLIFSVSVKHAQDIAGRIDGAVAVTAETKDRASIIRAFTNKEIPCLVNCMVFTEGTDLPLVETIILARPTQSDSLYAQMVGRGLRLYPGKEHLNLIDCVGITGKGSLCTAPSLLGIDLDNVPKNKQDKLEGMLLDLPARVNAEGDCPESWIRNIEIVDLWAKDQKYSTHDVNWFRMPDGSFVCSLLNNQRLVIPAQDELGMTQLGDIRVPMQKALDRAYMFLRSYYSEQAYIWDLGIIKRWGLFPATEKQLNLIRRKCKEFNHCGLNKLEASQILNRVLGGGSNGNRSAAPISSF
jgi:hypothetical protein